MIHVDHVVQVGTSLTIDVSGISQNIAFVLPGSGSGGGSSAWGGITGNIVDQTDLISLFNGKQPFSTILSATTASYTTTEQSKLAGIAAGATANSPDASLLDRANHTGSQAISTVTGLSIALAGLQPLATVLTNTTASYTTAEQTKLAGIAAGATANSADATLLARANHTGTQPSTTITGLGPLATASSVAAAQISDASTAGRAMVTAADAAAQAVLLNTAIAPAWANVTGKPTISGSNTGDQTITLTGDVTGSGTGSFAATLATVNATTGSFGSASAVATFTVDGKGRMTAAGSAAISIGWSAISSGKPTTISGYGITDAVTLTGAQTVAGVKTLSSELTLANVASPATPAAGNVSVFGRTITGHTVPAWISEDGLIQEFQASLAKSSLQMFKAQAGSNSLSSYNSFGLTSVGTLTSTTPSSSSKYLYLPRIDYIAAAAAVNAIGGFYRVGNSSRNITLGGSAPDCGGFRFVGSWGPAQGITGNSTHRAFFGMSPTNSLPTDVQPSSLIKIIGMGWDDSDTNVQFMCNDGTGTATKTDLGPSFPKPTADRTNIYELAMFSPKGTTQILYWRVVDLISGAVQFGSSNTDLPTISDVFSPRGYVGSGATSAQVGLTFCSLIIDPLVA